MKANLPYQSFLDCVTAGSLVVTKLDLLEVTVTTSVQGAMELMNQHHILSLPVYETDTGAYAGIVSVMDVVLYMDQTVGAHIKNESGEHLNGSVLAKTPVANIIGIGAGLLTGKRTRGLRAIPSTTPLSDCLDSLAEVPRLLVSLGYDRENLRKSLFRVLTATDIVKFLARHTDKLGSVLDIPIGSFVAPGKNFVVVPVGTATALQAYQQLTHSHSDAVALTDPSGRLIGTLSPSDTRGLAVDTLDRVLLPLEQYLNIDPATTLPGTHPGCVRIGDTLGHALKMIAPTKFHRLWVVDDDFRPIGVLRLVDILEQIRSPCVEPS
eukprot:comp16839_c0_seq1/m.15277 comp16839_c0_seq1/g.15277  ORF comp16839_c0_seq1/g.15277 comp16839_c0_seq1/m.15277 type:complete len:323 (-) comp16839_c0_seq1:120-1088(-)